MSPFPGMNPYLEQSAVWHDFHERAIPMMAELVGEQVGPDLIARIDEHIYIHEVPSEEGSLVGHADIAFSEIAPPATPVTSASARGTALMTAPAEVGLPAIDEERLAYVEIRDRESWKVIAVIELLSPSNKAAGRDRDQYLGKRGSITNSDAHFIELDLLRGGRRLPIDQLPVCDYYAMVSRVERRPKADVWPVLLRDRLPTIPIPLTPGRSDAQLDLQDVVNRVYRAARYEHYIYRHEPEPPLSAADLAWAKAIVAKTLGTKL